MTLLVYLLISFVLLVLVIIYYVLLKNKKQDINKTYANYLLTATEPDVAFTHQRLSNGQYVNYYLNYDSTKPNLLNKEINDYPVKGSGEIYKPKEHGDLTETDNGFRISGVDTIFECPDNWIWNKNTKNCTLPPICNASEVGKIKGLDYYTFNLNNVKSQIDDLKGDKDGKYLAKYHDRLYISCINDSGDFTVKSCAANKLYNQVDIQDDSVDPCILYDICNDKREYSIHQYDIGDGPLQDDEYYMCINSQSVIQKCPVNSVFNAADNGCIQRNMCALEEDNHTFYINYDSYFICKNGHEQVVNCINGVYSDDGFDKLACNVDKTITIVSYFQNNYIATPISLYTYKNNKRELQQVDSGTITRKMSLAPDESGFFTITERNDKLYPETTFNKYFIDYVDATTLEESQSIELTIDNYDPFKLHNIISVSYYVDMLSNFDWNIIEDRPKFNDILEKYYKYDTKIKHKNDDTFEKEAKDYFFFTSSSNLYSPNSAYVSYQLTDEFSGILAFADFNVENTNTLADSKLCQAFKVLHLTTMTDSSIIMYYVDCFDNTLCSIAFDSKIIPDSFEIESDGSLKSLFYNYPVNTIDPAWFSIRLSSISWLGTTITGEYYVLPEIFAILSFSTFIQLNKQFNILPSISLDDTITLEEYRISTENSYILDTPFTGSYTDLIDIQKKIALNLLDVEL
ncbi:Vp91 [Carcinus maenas nudivirus]|uniref:Vp91 n=1 Tax=Carcinus maenas nudivirus TaxID=2880837 RepID=A0AAE8Y0C7_9VIRU|nr:Vp91 [Carcinus maenas nudivirus]UBZ25595.1 Vp91 [Carcinus maenas nudivirus]